MRTFLRHAAVGWLLILGWLGASAGSHSVMAGAQSTEAASADPWSTAQTIQAADFARELTDANHTSTILYVGVRALYNGGHIPGNTFHGTTSTVKGLAEFKAFADTLPRSTNLVIYCGCCPLARCPNIRPAYSALKDMGFTHVRVLLLPTSFAADWAEKGYRVEKAN